MLPVFTMLPPTNLTGWPVFLWRTLARSIA